MTRKDYLKQECEAIINGKILPLLDKRENKEVIASKINWTAFMYSCGRMNPLTALMDLARLLTDEEFEEVIKEVK